MFGFQIKRRRNTVTKELEGWEVYLPHSCDHWEVAEEGNLTRRAAIDALQSFIDEARATLNVLESLPDDWQGHYGPDIEMRFETAEWERSH